MTADYLEPETLDEAQRLAVMPTSRVVAGGTGVAFEISRGGPRPQRLVSLARIGGLDRLAAHPKIGLDIGANVVIARAEQDIWVAKRWAALHEALDAIRMPQLHVCGTIVGNVCEGAPSHDVPIALMAHRAQVRIRDRSGSDRLVPLSEFDALGAGSALAAGEIVLSIAAPPPAADSGSAFARIAMRATAGGSRAAAYVALDISSDMVVDATVVFAGPDVRGQISDQASGCLRGRAVSLDAVQNAASAAITDLRENLSLSAAEVPAAVALVKLAVDRAMNRARSKHNPFDDVAALLRDGA